MTNALLTHRSPIAALVLACACAPNDDSGSPYGSGYSSFDEVGDEDSDGPESESGSESESTSESETGETSTTDTSTTESGSESEAESSTEDPTTGGGGGTPCATDNDPKQLLECGDQIQESFAGLYGDLDAACGHDFPWQDSIYHFIPPLGGATVTASYSVQGSDPGDGAIFVLEGACSEGSCVASSLDAAPYSSVSFAALDGVDYWFVYEAPSQQPTYTITIACE